MQPDFAYTVRHRGDDGRDDALLVRIQAKLWEHYPGWAWYVEIPPNQNIIVIKNYDCIGLGRPWGYVIKKTSIDASMKIVVKGGGELLERWRRRRGRVNVDELKDRSLDFQRPEM